MTPTALARASVLSLEKPVRDKYNSVEVRPIMDTAGTEM
jgi:hypothetical protein